MHTGNEFLDRLAQFVFTDPNNGFGISGLEDRLNTKIMTPYHRVRLNQEMSKRIQGDPTGEVRLGTRGLSGRERVLAGLPPEPEY